MQSSFSFFFYTIAFLIVFVLPAEAQQSLLLYPFAGYKYDALPALNREAGHLNVFQTGGTGTTYNHTGMAGIDILSPIPVLTGLRGSFRIGMEFSSGNFTSNPYSSGEAVDPVTSLPAASINTFSIDVSSVAFHLGVRITAPLMEQVSAFGGMWTSWIFSSESVLRERIVSSQETIFPSTKTGERLVVPEQELLQSPVRYGPVAGLSWTVQPAMGLSIKPEFSVSLDVRSRPLNRAFGVGAGIAFSYNGAASDLPAVLPVSPPPPVAIVHLFASDATGIRSDTAHLTLHSVLHRRYLPLVPILPIGKNDSSLAECYSLLTPIETSAFSIDKTAKDSLANFYGHTLNIIAQRLQTDTDATLSLSAFSYTETLRSQVETIYRYFIDVWSIDSTRLHIIPQTAIREVNSDNALILETSSPAVFAPVVGQWIEEEVSTPNIGMEKQITATAGIDRWQIAVTQDTSCIAVFSHAKTDSASNMSSFPLYSLHLDSLPKPLIAELLVADSAGRVVTTNDSLPMIVNNAPATERRTYFFFADQPGADNITVLNNALLSHLLDFIDNTTIVAIDPSAQPDSLWNATFLGEKLLSLLNSRNIHPARIDISSPACLLFSPMPQNVPLLPALRITAERPRR